MVISIEINVSDAVHYRPLILLYPFVARIIANKRDQDDTSREGRRERGWKPDVAERGSSIDG